MKKILMCIISAILFLSLFSEDGNIMKYLKEGKITDILKEMSDADEKNADKIITAVYKNRALLAVEKYNVFLSAVSAKREWMLHYSSLIDEKSITNSEYSQLYKFFKKISNQELIAFIMKYQYSDIEFARFVPEMKKEGLLEEIYKRSDSRTNLKIYAAMEFYKAEKDSDYLRDVSKGDEKTISDIFDNYSLSLYDKKMILSQMKKPKKFQKGILDEIAEMSIYDINCDYSEFFKNSEYYASYKNMKSAFNTGVFTESKSVNLHSLYSALITKNYKAYDSLRESFKEDKQILIYIDCLNCLFRSDIKGFKKRLAQYLVTTADKASKMKLIDYFLTAKYIQDGEVFYLIEKNDVNSLKSVLYVAGQNTPLFYEVLMESNEEKKALDIKNKVKADKLKYFQILLYDYQNERIEKEAVADFLEEYPQFPFNKLFMDML